VYEQLEPEHPLEHVQESMRVQVQCYAGYRGEETPLRFHLGARCVEVDEVLDRWLAPDHRYFKVRGDDGGIYILRHDEADATWELRVYDANPPQCGP
jgi:hypothetical protein